MAFFNPLRLCDRITLQYRLRGSDEAAPKGMVLAAAVVGVIAYIGILDPDLVDHRDLPVAAQDQSALALAPVELQPQLQSA